MGSRLLRVRPALQKIGIEIVFERTRDSRTITIVKKAVLNAVKTGKTTPTAVRDLAPDGLNDEGDDCDEGDDDCDADELEKNKKRRRRRGFAAVHEEARRVEGRKRARARRTL
jgi:hypothetical protein